MEFTIIKSRAVTLSKSLRCRAFSRAVMDGKSSSLLLAIGGGQWLQMTSALFDNTDQYLPFVMSVLVNLI